MPDNGHPGMTGAFRLPADTTTGPVRLRVADLDRSLGFYREMLGLRVAHERKGTVALAPGDDAPTLVTLVETPGIRRRAEGTPGLYHYALLYPDRLDLARTLFRMFEQRVPFQGFADHGVSEAAYLSDPDGNGIELAADRPREQWRRENGDLVMYTHALNVTDLLRRVDGDPWLGAPAGLRVGHVHLHVSDLDAAESFYNGVLGFDVTNRSYPGARFLAAGGYHHHIGINTWARGARPADDAVAGLIDFSLLTAAPVERAALLAHLERLTAVEMSGDDPAVRDPDGNVIRIL
jgi:catechol 2,3-dioxygenase